MKRFAEWVTGLGKISRSKLSLKIFIAIFTVLSLTFLLSFVLFGTLLPRAFEQEFISQFNEFIWEFGLAFQAATEDELPHLVEKFGMANGINITVHDGYYNIAYQHISFSPDTVKHDDFIISHRFVMSNTITGQSYSGYATASLGAVRSVTSIVNGIVPHAMIASLLISASVAYVYSRRLTKPIIVLSKMSRKMSLIDLSSRCNINRNDEIGELSLNLNTMAEKLEIALIELQSANEKLQRDFDMERKQEEHRRDLFTAISHELKTPLTILKGELGGMIDNIGVYKDRDTYLHHAVEITGHLERLVQEILTVSRLEANELSLDYSVVDIGDLTNRLCQKYEDLAETQRVSIACYCDEDVVVEVDSLQMQTALSNIISNAIFHSPKGEIVNIQLIKDKECGVLTVENVGSIDKSDLANLFEPFYRADKSRSRYTGGSGLGLYIVKRILDMHKISYGIDSVNSKVIFKVILPLNT
ncbi:MAG: HAMP domain-containing histidine kinase [Defluviitaleaceae bacterium]|nr:HAMP domain-containing histidine kinase [Defluviitaleaceae bacterium]